MVIEENIRCSICAAIRDQPSAAEPYVVESGTGYRAIRSPDANHSAARSSATEQ
jgi:hypothetical protein